MNWLILSLKGKTDVTVIKIVTMTVLSNLLRYLNESFVEVKTWNSVSGFSQLKYSVSSGIDDIFVVLGGKVYVFELLLGDLLQLIILFFTVLITVHKFWDDTIGHSHDVPPQDEDYYDDDFDDYNDYDEYHSRRHHNKDKKK